MNSEHVEVLRQMWRQCANDRRMIEADALDSAIAALSAPQPGEWVLVPREPTLAMVIAWRDAPDVWVEAYAAMLHAAPPPPAEAQPVGRGCGDHDHASYIPGCGRCASTLPEKRMAAPPSAPVGVDGVKCPWDGGSPCVEPRPIGMVYPMKPAPRASGYLDGSGVEWNAWDAEQMEAYARAAYSDGWEAGYRSALAQQPAAVDEAMVERATMALLGKTHDSAPGVDWRCDRSWTVNRVRELMRLALSAALAGQQDNKS